MGQSYALEFEIPTYQNLITPSISISIRPQNRGGSFTLKFRYFGQITCLRKAETGTTPGNVVRMNLIGMNIEIYSDEYFGDQLFFGNCDFSFQDIYIENLDINLLSLDSGVNLEFRNFTISNVRSKLISKNAVFASTYETGSIVFDSVTLKAGVYSILSFDLISYNVVEFRNCVIGGIEIFMSGTIAEHFKIQNSTFNNGMFFLNSISMVIFESSTFETSQFQIINTEYEFKALQMIISNCSFANTSEIHTDGARGNNEAVVLDFSISDSKFYNNNVAENGGFFSFRSFITANLTLFNSYFKSNIANLGGVIACQSGSQIIMTCENNTFESNAASEKGGVFDFTYQGQIQVIMRDNRFINNTAKYGGVISIHDSQGSGNLSITDSLFISNIAAQEGGVVYLESAELYLDLNFENDTFELCSALVGAIFIFQPLQQLDVMLESNIYRNNNATFGAVMAVQGSQQGIVNVTSRNSSFISNTAINGGGVAYIGPGIFEVKITFENNSLALNSGFNGGVFHFQPVKQIQVILKNDSYNDNRAKFGGVICVQTLTEVHTPSNIDLFIIASKFNSNQASTSGGALAFSMSNNKGKITIINSEFKSNVATTRGGGALHFEMGELGTTLTFQNNTFESNQAISGGALNFESLNQVQIVLQSNIYKSNIAALGAAIAFQSFRATELHFNINVLIDDSKFHSNQASNLGGALALLMLKKGNFTVANSEFKMNNATAGGGVLYSAEASAGVLINFQGSSFSFNSAFKGGAFLFESIYEAQLSYENNQYIQNVAKSVGGVGYISQSNLDFKDFNSRANSNIAGIEGGAWSVKGKSSNMDFEDITFEDNLARNCSTSARGALGGALYLVGASTITGNQVTFIDNQAEFGASLLFESTRGEQNHTLTNLNFESGLAAPIIDYPVQSQIQSNKGGLVLQSVTISGLNTPFLSHTEGIIEIKDITFSNVNCRLGESSLTYCLFSLQGSMGTAFLNIKGLNAQNISSTFPLIMAKKSSLILESLVISNVNSTAEVSVGSFEESSIKIQNIELSNLDSNFIQVSKDSVLDISYGIFDNHLKKIDVNSKTPKQFIVLSDSSILINSTTFNFNSPIFTQDGGAIKLKSPKNVKLLNVNFTENRAVKGGALFIEGNTIKGIISKCRFISNMVPNDTFENPGFGGAIYIQNLMNNSTSRLIQQNSDPTFVIEDSLFKENSATGGAIYTKETSLLLQNNIFDSNVAVSGGCLSTEIKDPILAIDILNSEFENNIGLLYGASIFQLRNDAIRNQTGTTFTNETQRFDRGVPAKLRIKTFLYDATTQYVINSFSVSDLEKSGHLTLEYDSFNDSNIKLKDVKGGVLPNRLLEISIWDSRGNHLTELTSNYGQILLSISNATYSSKSSNNVSSIAGVNTKTLTNGSVIFFEETSFFAFPETLLDIHVTANIIHRNLGNLIYILNATLQIQLSNCVIGEVFNNQTFMCDPCKPNYFSFTDPFSTSICRNCDLDKAECPGGALIYPKPGYWRLGPMSDNLIECPFQPACLGARRNESGSEAFSLTGLCNELEGYEGNACAKCKPDFAKFGSNGQCTNCKETKIYYVRLFGLLAIQIGIMIFNIYSKVLDQSSQRVCPQAKMFLQLIVSFLWVKNTCFQFFLWLIAQGSNANVFFYKILLINFQPFVFFLFGVLFWVFLVKVIKKQNIRHNSQFTNNLLVTNSLIAYILQPDIIKSTLQLFKCQNLGSQSNPQTFLEQDLEIRCGESTHLGWALGLGIPALLFWFILPVMIFIRIMFRAKEINKDKETLERYHFIFKRYNESEIYWDLVILLRKAAIIFLLVFLDDLYLQIFISLLVCLLSLHLHFTKQPYNDELNLIYFSKTNIRLNELETLSLISNCLLLFGGLFFIQNTELGVFHWFLIVLIFLINLMFFFGVTKALYWLISIKVKGLLKKKKPKEVLTSNEDAPESPKITRYITEDENKELLRLQNVNNKKSSEELINLFDLNVDQDNNHQEKINI